MRLVAVPQWGDACRGARQSREPWNGEQMSEAGPAWRELKEHLRKTNLVSSIHSTQ